MRRSVSIHPPGKLEINAGNIFLTKYLNTIDGENKNFVNAIVVFSDDTELFFLKWFRRGFRHCFVAVCIDDCWIIYDPLSHQTHFSLVKGIGCKELAS
ncbi:MAG: hypothetical protein IPK66_02725 [Rhodospirillales bacterium]|nr:hypothetical protein [Rhodospirillales bacterium]